MINLEAHPIDQAIRQQIEAKLLEIEAEHAVEVIFACESGSRGWGFASPDSDYDVRFLYVHRLPWYLRVSAERDVIELPISDVLDINGWDLRKALGLLRKGNATLIEWLSSPVVYRADPIFLDAIRVAAVQAHGPQRSAYHYLHMARKNYREYLRGDQVRLKKYLYVLRPLLATLWIERGLGVVPMRFQELVESLVQDATLQAAIDDLLLIKRSVGEAEMGSPMPVINQFIEHELARLQKVDFGSPPDVDYAILDRLLFETVMRLRM